jgi:hypothetical protein
MRAVLLTLLGVTVLTLSLFAPAVGAQELKFDPADPAVKKGHEIMQATFNLPVVEKVFFENELRIYDKQDKLLYTKRARGAQYFQDFASGEKRLQRSLSFFFEPADDQGNGAMVFEHEKTDDDEQYLYLRQTRKARRIIGASKKDDYFGSDFRAADVVRRRYPDYNFRFLGEEKLEFNGKPTPVLAKIESQHKDPQKREDWNEGKSIIWIHPSSGLVFKAERYDTQMQMDKVAALKAFTKTKNKKGEEVYLVAAIDISTVNRGTHSMFVITKRMYEGEAGFATDIFTTDSFTKQWW